MTEIKHTPEPWYCGIDPIDEPAEPRKGIDWVIYTKDDNGWENGILAPMWGDNREADAKRIVACVNACAGIPTESLEAGVVAFLINAFLRKERTEAGSDAFADAGLALRESYAAARANASDATEGDANDQQ